MKIASKTPNLKVKSSNPSFSYAWKNADEPIDVKDDHAEKILNNPNFYLSDKEVKKTQSKPKEGKPAGRTKKIKKNKA